MFGQEVVAQSVRRQRGELQHGGQVVGELASSERQAYRRIDALEPEQSHAPLAGVALRVEGQVEAGTLLEVEGLHVFLLQVKRRAGLKVSEEPLHRVSGAAGRQLGDGLSQLRTLRQQLLAGVLEEQREELVGRPSPRPRQPHFPAASGPRTGS